MYVMNYLKDIIQSQKMLNTCSNIINFYDESSKITGEEYFSIYSFILNLSESEKNIYQAFHILLDLKVIEKKEFTQCPLCGKENEFNHITSSIKCSYCKDFFNQDFITERFKLIYDK